MIDVIKFIYLCKILIPKLYQYTGIYIFHQKYNITLDILKIKKLNFNKKWQN